jgi:purine-binding chemotaxis protein CheW
MPTAQSMETVWRERAARLARRSASVRAPQDELQVMVLRIGDERYCVELSNVVEVLPPIRCTAVPGAPRAIAGVINAHGEIRPVIDLRRLMGIGHPAADAAPGPVILLRKRGRLMGLQADRVEEIRSIASAGMRSTEAGQAGFLTHYLKGLTQDTLMLLNTDALFAELSIEKESKS